MIATAGATPCPRWPGRPKKGCWGFFVVLSKKTILFLDVWEKWGRHIWKKQVVGIVYLPPEHIRGPVRCERLEAFEEEEGLEESLRCWIADPCLAQISDDGAEEPRLTQDSHHFSTERRLELKQFDSAALSKSATVAHFTRERAAESFGEARVLEHKEACLWAMGKQMQ